MIRALLVGVLAILSMSGSGSAQALAIPAPVNAEKAVDEVFAKWTASTPGCAVGVAIGGKPVLTKAYGMADLEHDVRNTPETIFESGSLAKQFTALAVTVAGKRRHAVAGRFSPQVHPRATRLQGAADDPSHALAHQRIARLGQHREHRGVAADDARVHACARAGNRLASEGAELSAGHQVVL